MKQFARPSSTDAAARMKADNSHENLCVDLCGIELTRTAFRTAFRTGRTGRAQVESPNETRRSDHTNLCGAQVRTPIPLVRPRTVPQTVGRGTGHTPVAQDQKQEIHQLGK